VALTEQDIHWVGGELAIIVDAKEPPPAASNHVFHALRSHSTYTLCKLTRLVDRTIRRNGCLQQIAANTASIPQDAAAILLQGFVRNACVGGQSL